MTKFEKVCKALEIQTFATNNYITLTKNVSAASNGKYATENIITNNISQITYNTLDDIIKEYDLTI
ncbi:MAG TPA: hypothetical protein GXZ90_01975 [Clostridiales bacterium]|nr:hypothetical protein [Clostridiales bacterium]